jgi:hypothetical protein
MHLDNMLHLFQEKRTHMAAVYRARPGTTDVSLPKELLGTCCKNPSSTHDLIQPPFPHSCSSQTRSVCASHNTPIAGGVSCVFA